MEFRHLKYFVATAEEENVNRAARRLRTSAPSLSRQIRQLENEMGVQLFARAGRGMRLTEVGTAFLRGARLVLADLNRSVAGAQAAARGESGRFSIAFTETSSYGDAIPDIISRLNDRHPNIICKILQMDWGDVAPALKAGRINAAFCNHVAAEVELKSEALFEERMQVAIPRRHPLAKERAVTLAQLRNERLIIKPPRTLPYCFRDLAAELVGCSQNVAIEASSTATQLSLVSSGMGVTLLAARKRVPQTRGVVLKPLPELRFRLVNFMLWNAEEGGGPVLESLRKIGRDLVPALREAG